MSVFKLEKYDRSYDTRRKPAWWLLYGINFVRATLGG